jgi:hypothetical protein
MLSAANDTKAFFMVLLKLFRYADAPAKIEL